MISRSAAKVITRQLFVFGAVGVINTCVDFAAFYLTYEYAVRSIIIANVVGWCVSVQGSYLMNSRVTFRDTQRRGGWLQYAKFVASCVAVLVTNTTAVFLLSLIVPIYWAKLLSTGVSFATNFTLSKFVVFASASRRPASAGNPPQSAARLVPERPCP